MTNRIIKENRLNSNVFFLFSDEQPAELQDGLTSSGKQLFLPPSILFINIATFNFHLALILLIPLILFDITVFLYKISFTLENTGIFSFWL